MATGPSCGWGKWISLWEKLVWEKLVTDAGPKSGFPVKLIESGIARSKLIDNRTAPPIKVGVNPQMAAVVPQTMPPRAIAPCEAMMTVAFMRPLDQLGIARCDATQSSDADNVHPIPAAAATIMKMVWSRTNAIKR